MTRVADLAQSITPATAKAVEAFGLANVVTFLNHASERLKAGTEEQGPDAGVVETEFELIRRGAIFQLAKFPCRANELAHVSAMPVRTGFLDLDALLCGGLRSGDIVEFIGPSPSGKSLKLPPYVVAPTSHRLRRSPAFIRGTLEPSIVSWILSSMTATSCMMCCLPWSQQEMVLPLPTIQVGRKKIVIVDSIAAVCAPILGQCTQGHAMLASIGSLLRRIAASGTIILVTNHSLGGAQPSSQEEKAALGGTWTVISTHRIGTSVAHTLEKGFVHIALEVWKSIRKLPNSDRTATIKITV
eukprot:Opistho-2@6364